MNDPTTAPAAPSPAAASQPPLSTDGVQEAQSGATTDAAKEAADRLAAGKLAAEQADLQRKFLAELLKRERLAVQSFCVFLELLPKSIHLDEPGETARSAAVSAAANLDAVLGIGEQMMAAHHG